MIPPDSLVLVTGANGLIASHVVDALLAHGYQVRGQVRDRQRCGWMEKLYTGRHGPGRFSLIQVPDLLAPDCWAGAIKGVSGVAHVAGCADPTVQDVEAGLAAEVKLYTSILEAAAREESVRGFVSTSSAWACWTPDAGRAVTLTEGSWNEEAIALARSSARPEQKGLSTFMAIKTMLEQACWEWVRAHKPAYTFNTILLDTVMGKCLDPVNQGIPSTAGMVYDVWKGTNRQILNVVQPQWHIDTADAGLLYLAALTTPGVDRERIFAFGERYSWKQVGDLLTELHGKEIRGLVDQGLDQTTVPNERGAELLRGLGRKGWTGLKESVTANAESFLVLEPASA